MLGSVRCFFTLTQGNTQEVQCSSFNLCLTNSNKSIISDII